MTDPNQEISKQVKPVFRPDSQPNRPDRLHSAQDVNKTNTDSRELDYSELQDIYLKWHNGHRPLSGFIRDLQSYTANKQREQELADVALLGEYCGKLGFMQGVQAFIVSKNKKESL